MALALEYAKLAYFYDEVPVGAILVKDDIILGVGFNMKEMSNQANKHAELVAIEDASKKSGGWRLDGSTLYSSLEPCPMCAGALLQARVMRVVYAAKDIKWGAVTKTNMLDGKRFNHHLVYDYLPCDLSVSLLKTFFKQKRKKVI